MGTKEAPSRVTIAERTVGPPMAMTPAGKSPNTTSTPGVAWVVC